jgi:hypothetical protein
VAGVVAPIDWLVVQKAIRDWVVNGSDLPREKVVWGDQDGARPEGVAITMLLMNDSDGDTWRDTENNPLVFSPITISAIDASTNIATAVGHGRLTGDGPVQVASTDSLPGGLPSNGLVYIVRVDNDRVRFASTFFDALAGSPPGSSPVTIDLTDAGSGTITVASTSESLRAAQEIRHVVRGLERVTVELRCHAATKAQGAIGVGNSTGMAILSKVRSSRRLPSQLAIMEAANISVVNIDRVRHVQGMRDAMLYEPRFYLDVHIQVPWETYEYGTIIQRAHITNLLTGDVLTVTGT